MDILLYLVTDIHARYGSSIIPLSTAGVKPRVSLLAKQLTELASHAALACAECLACATKGIRPTYDPSILSRAETKKIIATK